METIVCPTCNTPTVIMVRSIEDTFWCLVCGKWQRCPPRAPQS